MNVQRWPSALYIWQSDSLKVILSAGSIEHHSIDPAVCCMFCNQTWGSCASVRKYTSLSLFYNGLQFQIGIHLDSHKESPFGESLTNPDRNLIVSWDPMTTFLLGKQDQSSGAYYRLKLLRHMVSYLSTFD